MAFHQIKYKRFSNFILFVFIYLDLLIKDFCKIYNENIY